jgi:hypothetical protein
MGTIPEMADGERELLHTTMGRLFDSANKQGIWDDVSAWFYGRLMASVQLGNDIDIVSDIARTIEKFPQLVSD